MKKKLIVGAVVLALVGGVVFWVLKGDDIKEKAAEKVVETVVEKVVEDAVDEAKNKLIQKLIP
jgi:hypothetical protein|tara:strand:+ start:361 stop:549 length:189 start_codon:yes stop_codon:yes gene_type:complete